MMRDCPDEAMRDLLPDFVHETLPALDRARVAGHVASCADCAAEIGLIRSARSALVSRAPSVDVSRIVASLPGAPLKSRGGGRRFTQWRIAAAITLVALGGLSVVVLRGFFDGVPGGAKARAPWATGTGRPGPDTGPAALQVPVTPRGRELADAMRENGISFGGGLSDLTEDQLKTLLREIDALEAMPSAEPEIHATPIVPLREGDNHA